MQQQSQNNQLRYTGSRSRMMDVRRSPLAAPEEIPRTSEMGVTVPRPTKTDVIPGGWEEDVLRLLAHFDAQESAMLALKSLLQDLGAVGAENEDTRRLRIRMDAATELCRRLDSDCRLIVQQLAERMQIPLEDFVVHHLISAVHEHNTGIGAFAADGKATTVETDVTGASDIGDNGMDSVRLSRNSTGRFSAGRRSHRLGTDTTLPAANP